MFILSLHVPKNGKNSIFHICSITLILKQLSRNDHYTDMMSRVQNPFYNQPGHYHQGQGKNILFMFTVAEQLNLIQESKDIIFQFIIASSAQLMILHCWSVTASISTNIFFSNQLLCR